MTTTIATRVHCLLAGYVDIPVGDFDPTADLDLDYGIDSTEMIEMAVVLKREFLIEITRSQRDDWRTGADIVAFVEKAALAPSCGAEA
jgi:acyl carrier protein